MADEPGQVSDFGRPPGAREHVADLGGRQTGRGRSWPGRPALASARGDLASGFKGWGIGPAWADAERAPATDGQFDPMADADARQGVIRRIQAVGGTASVPSTIGAGP